MTAKQAISNVPPTVPTGDFGIKDHRLRHWHTCQRQVVVHGLPTLAGTLTATCGVLGLLKTNDGRTVIVHPEWCEAVKVSRAASQSKKSKVQQLLEELLA
jgi:hypothetical protein